jgi:hypothetical protein
VERIGQLQNGYSRAGTVFAGCESVVKARRAAFEPVTVGIRRDKRVRLSMIALANHPKGGMSDRLLPPPGFLSLAKATIIESLASKEAFFTLPSPCEGL